MRIAAATRTAPAPAWLAEAAAIRPDSPHGRWSCPRAPASRAARILGAIARFVKLLGSTCTYTVSLVTSRAPSPTRRSSKHRVKSSCRCGLPTPRFPARHRSGPAPSTRQPGARSGFRTCRQRRRQARKRGAQEFEASKVDVIAITGVEHDLLSVAFLVTHAHVVTKWPGHSPLQLRGGRAHDRQLADCCPDGGRTVSASAPGR